MAKNITITILIIFLIISCCFNIFFVVSSFGSSLSNLKISNLVVPEVQINSGTKEMILYTLENYYLQPNELTDKYSCAIKVIDYAFDGSVEMKGIEKYYFIASCYGYKNDAYKTKGYSFSNHLFYAEYLGTNAIYEEKKPEKIKEFDMPYTYLNSNDKNFASDKDKKMINLLLNYKSNDLDNEAMSKALK